MPELEHITDLVDRMTHAPSFEAAAGALAEWAREVTGCDSALVRVRQPSASGEEWVPVVASSGSSPEFLRDEVVVDGSECLCGQVATGRCDSEVPFFTDGGSFLWGRVDRLGDEFPPEVIGPIRGRCVDEGYASLAIVPLGDEDHAPVLGCVHMAARKQDAFEGREGLLQAAGRIAGRLLQNHKQQDSERAALQTIKEALLPPQPPRVPGLELGVYATTADELMQVGGDFYEVWDLATGNVALVTGDHSGKGLDAVGTAARLRVELTTLASSADDPATFMESANAALSRLLSPGTFVSAVCCTIEPDRGVMRLCLAGHPGPLRVRRGAIEELEAPSNLPLGVDADHHFDGVTYHLEEGDLLILYTDGVPESRNNGHLFGVEGVTRVVRTSVSSTPAEIAQAVVSAAAEHHDAELPADDRLVLVARIAP